jgi:vancomycin aglycone glucosyltransferase
MIALGRELQANGHGVRFATSPPFRDEIIAAGLEFVELPPRWTTAELSYWMGRLQNYSNPLFQLRELYRAASPHISDLIVAMDRILSGTDVLVSSYLFPMNRAIAERHGVHFATFAFAHNTVPSRHFPPDGLPRLRYFPRRIQQSWNRFLWRLGNVAVDTVVNQTIARQLRAHGLPMVKDFFSKPADLVLVGVSPGLMKPQCRLNRRFRFVGYCRWQSERNEEVEREIERFIDGQSVPVLSFGSMVYGDPTHWMARLAKAWPRDRKLIVQSGWAGFRPPDGLNHIKVVGAVCHDWLFRRASVVIHHGGAGTTASVLHSGRPHVVVPHIADQGFFANEIKRLGCGIRLNKKRWPEKLARAVLQVESSAAMVRNAVSARRTLLGECGPEAAVRSIEEFVSVPKQNGRVASPESVARRSSAQLGGSGA